MSRMILVPCDLPMAKRPKRPKRPATVIFTTW